MAGIVVGTIGTLAYFGFIGFDLLGLPFSFFGVILAAVALFMPPRSILLGLLALLCSGSPLAFVLVSLMLGIKC